MASESASASNANPVHGGDAVELSEHAIARLHICLLDADNGARSVLALTDAIVALQRDKFPR